MIAGLKQKIDQLKSTTDANCSWAELLEGIKAVVEEVNKLDPRPTAGGDQLRAPDFMEQGARTFRERNKAYGDSYLEHGSIMAALFHSTPVVLDSPAKFGVYHLLDLKVVKLNRFCNAFQQGIFHQDSIHDDGVYSFMLEELGERMKQQ
jgi:hypothetical protein